MSIQHWTWLSVLARDWRYLAFNALSGMCNTMSTLPHCAVGAHWYCRTDEKATLYHASQLRDRGSRKLHHVQSDSAVLTVPDGDGFRL